MCPDLFSSSNLSIVTDDLDLRDFIRIFKDGSLYYAKENNGTLLSSSSSPETVIQAAIDAGGSLGRHIYIKGGTYTFSGGFAGINITDQNDKHIQMSRDCKLTIPNGYSGHVFKIEGDCKGIHISGGAMDEAGTPSKLWKAVHLKSTGSGDAIKHCKFDFMEINNAGWWFYLECTTGGAFINSNEWNNIWGYYPIVGFEWVDVGSNFGFLHNHYYNIDIQADSNTLYGFKNVRARSPVFVGCEVQDMDAADTQMLIHADGADTIIVGGSLNSGGSTGLFTDNGTNTTFIARGTTGMSVGRDAIFKGGFTSQGFTRFEGDISPTQLTADQTDYNPTNLSTSSRIRQDSDSSFRSIGGLAGGADGRRIAISNISANTFLLSDENTTHGQASTAANRFAFGGYDVPIFPNQEITLEYDSTVSRWRLINGQFPIIPPNRFGYHDWSEVNNNVNQQFISLVAASGGSVNNVAGTTRHWGVREWTLGTSTTGSGSFTPGTTLNQLGPLGNSQYWRFDMLLKIQQLSNATDNYTLRVGFIDSASAESTDGAFFRYNHGVNSGKWQKVTRNNSSEAGSANDTGVTAQTTNYSLFTVIINPAGNNAQFFIDGTSVGNETTNIPTGGGRDVSYGMMFLKSAGTTDTAFLRVDMLELLSYTNIARTL